MLPSVSCWAVAVFRRQLLKYNATHDTAARLVSCPRWVRKKQPRTSTRQGRSNLPPSPWQWRFIFSLRSVATGVVFRGFGKNKSPSLCPSFCIESCPPPRDTAVSIKKVYHWMSAVCCCIGLTKRRRAKSTGMTAPRQCNSRLPSKVCYTMCPLWTLVCRRGGSYAWAEPLN